MTISPEFDFPKVHKAEIISVAISSTGKYIMSADSETQIIIWSIKGIKWFSKIIVVKCMHFDDSSPPITYLEYCCSWEFDI